MYNFIQTRLHCPAHGGEPDRAAVDKTTGDSFLGNLEILIYGVPVVKLRRHFPVMLGEYWIYLLAALISTVTLVLLYSHKGAAGLLH